MKHQAIFFLVTLLMSMGCIKLFAYDIAVANADGKTIYYRYIYINQSKELAVSYYNEYGKDYSGNIVIPEYVTYNGITYHVTSIGKRAFRDCRVLTSITIPNSVTSIGERAFYNCSGLTSITIPNSVTSIGDRAFSGSGWYNNHADGPIYLDNWLIGWKGEKPTGELYIAEGTIGLAGGVFEKCTAITSVTIPNTLKYIGEGWSGSGLNFGGAFMDCSGLTSVTIGNSVTSIGDFAFSGCNGLTSVHITDLEAWCKIKFSGSESNPLYYAKHLYLNEGEIKDLDIPNSINKIEKYSFYGCSGLTSVTIPNSVTSIGYRAFEGCSNLTSVTIGNSVTSIGDNSFLNCSNLTSITIPNSVTSIGKNAFYSCSNLTSITIPNSVTSIGENAFRYCSGLTSVTIGNSVTGIGKYAFESCNNIKAVYSYITDLFDCGNSESFSSYTYRKGMLYVPLGTKDLYMRFVGWKEFMDIIEMENEAEKYNLTIVVNNKKIITTAVEEGDNITPPTKDNDGNTITWYTYPSTMPAHDLVVYGMVVKPEPEPAPTKYTLSYILDGRQYKQEAIEEGATVAKETEPSKEGYSFSGWQNEPTTMPGRNVTVTGSFTINSYRLSFIAENRELSAKNQQYGTSITAPTKDSEGNTIIWYTYPSTMPAHDLVVYGMVVKPEPVPEPEVFVWLTVKDGQGTTKMQVKQGTEQKLTITPEEGWKLLMVTMDGQDVTAQVKDGGTLTTPAIMQDATITIVYEQDAPSEVSAARQSQATIKVVDDGVIISNAEPNTRCAVYQTDGKQVVNTVINDASRKITLTKSQAYILTLGTRTLKFSL